MKGTDAGCVQEQHKKSLGESWTTLWRGVNEELGMAMSEYWDRLHREAKEGDTAVPATQVRLLLNVPALGIEQ